MDPGGGDVADRLRGTPGAVAVPSDAIELFILRDFLSAGECAHLISLIDASCKPSTLFAEHSDPAFRTSQTSNLDRRDAVVGEVELRIASLLGLPPAHGEFLQGQRYATGQEFKPHHDVLRTDLPYWQRQKQVGGQRTWTAMAFLNLPDEGGETYFPAVRVVVKPRVGSLVAWNNLDRGGAPNRATLHQGMPVKAGTKYVITKWFRERPYGPEGWSGAEPPAR